jgi:four helix bundle protein
MDWRELHQRLLIFGTEVSEATQLLPRSAHGSYVRKQLIKSANTPHAQYAEAQSAESPKDFIHKIHVALKEMRETQGWLQVCTRITRNRFPKHLAPECNELTAILVTIIKNTRKSNPDL